jgi:hypothetical protein
MHFVLLVRALNYSFNGGLLFNFNFDIIITFFLNPHFSFSVCDKYSVIISKVHNESIRFLKLTDAFIVKGAKSARDLVPYNDWF